MSKFGWKVVLSTQRFLFERRCWKGKKPPSKKLFFKKIPLILLGLVWGGATPATPGVFGNYFLLHP
jgi:hypothetical protein